MKDNTKELAKFLLNPTELAKFLLNPTQENFEKAKVNKIYIIYDLRALDNPDDAVIFEVCETLEEAKDSLKDYGSGVIYSYDDDGTNTLINPKLEETYII